MAHIGSPFQNACILVGVGVAAIIINSVVITKIGRRRVFLVTGLTLCGLAQLLAAVVYTVHPGTVSTGKAIVGLSVLYIIAYNVSGPEQLVMFAFSKLVTGNDINIRLDFRRRAAVSKTAILHLWTRCCSGFLRGLARHFHGTILHQSRRS